MKHRKHSKLTVKGAHLGMKHEKKGKKHGKSHGKRHGRKR